MKLPKNESNLDRGIRIVIGLGALAFSLFLLTGIAQIVAFIIGSIALLTGLVGTCGIYILCGRSTCHIKK